MAIIFNVTEPAKLLDLARKATGGYVGVRTTKGVATKEQQGIVFKQDYLLPRRNENLHSSTEINKTSVPKNVTPCSLRDYHTMKAMDPKNWVSPDGRIEEYLDISEYPLIGSMSAIPQLVKVNVERLPDTVVMTVTFFMGQGKSIVLNLEPGVAMLYLEVVPSLAVSASDLVPNRILGNGREVYILPDERSEMITLVNHDTEIFIINKHNVFDDETGVEWLLIKENSTGLSGWMPKAAISQYSALFGEPVIDCREFIDATLYSSYCFGGAEDYNKQALATCFESLLADQLRKHLTAIVAEQVKKAYNL